MITDAAVVSRLSREILAAHPAKDVTTASALHNFSKTNNLQPDVVHIVTEACQRLKLFIEILPRQTEIQRKTFTGSIDRIQKAFSLDILGRPLTIFHERLGPAIEPLDYLDWMISSQQFWRSREIDVADASSLVDELKTVIAEGEFPDYLKSSLLNDLERLRFIIDNYDKFGPQDFWEKLQTITGLFGSLYETLNPKAKAQTAPVLRKLIERVRGALSVSADVAQLATTAYGFLPHV